MAYIGTRCPFCGAFVDVGGAEDVDVGEVEESEVADE